jgi:hypothetical protein
MLAHLPEAEAIIIYLPHRQQPRLQHLVRRHRLRRSCAASRAYASSALT